jgi:hypothetical protein
MKRRMTQRGVHGPPPPPSFDRCSTGCGRLVWFFDTMTCWECDVNPVKKSPHRASKVAA